MAKLNLQFQRLLISLIILFLPTQLGKHFWPQFSYVFGLRSDYLSPTIYFVDVLIFALFLLSFKKALSVLINSLRTPRNLIFFIFIFVFFALNIFLSPTPLLGIIKLLRLLELIFLASFLIRETGRIIKINTIINFLSISLLYESFLAIWQFMAQKTIGGFWWWLGERTFDASTPLVAKAVVNGQILLRSYGTFSHPNTLAAFLMIALTIVLIYHKSSKTIFNYQKKILYFVLFLVVSAAMFLTFSRLVWFLYLIILILLFLPDFIRQKKLLFLLFTALITVFYFFNQTIISRFLALYDIDLISITNRMQLNEAAIGMFIQHPVFGAGLNNFLILLPQYLSISGMVRFYQPAHNLILLIAAETGIVGLSVFILVNFYTFKHLISKKNKSIIKAKYLILLLFVFLILSMFDHYFFTQTQGQLLMVLVYSMCWTGGKAVYYERVNRL